MERSDAQTRLLFSRPLARQMCFGVLRRAFPGSGRSRGAGASEGSAGQHQVGDCEQDMQLYSVHTRFHCQSFFRPVLPRALALTCWSFLVVTAGVVAAALILIYVKIGEGITRQALVPYVLCTSPLMFCGLLAIPLFPAQRARK